MPLPDEYDSWRCFECPPDVNCKADWMVCDCCTDGLDIDGEECDDCSGSGGGHVCIHDEDD